MSEGRQRAVWDSTSVIWATIANANRDPKKRSEPFCPSEIHPYRAAEEFREEQPQHADLLDLEALIKRNGETWQRRSKQDGPS